MPGSAPHCVIRPRLSLPDSFSVKVVEGHETGKMAESWQAYGENDEAQLA